MRRIKSFKLFENKDITLEDILPKDILYDLWGFCRDLGYFDDHDIKLRVQVYLVYEEDSLNLSEWLLDTSLSANKTPDDIDYEYLMRNHDNFDYVKEVYLKGAKTYLRFGMVEDLRRYPGYNNRLLLDKTEKIYNIAKSELDISDNIELVKLNTYAVF
jgi:hypothetical protein